MKYSFFDFLNLVGSLAFFIYGMKIMSEAIQKVAGSKMRQILKQMTSNRFKGVLTGFMITGVIQSSSATTVLVVSFVNAGLLSLIESIGVIMGANIGTTVTAWLISIIGFKVNISSYALPIIGIGFPMLFFARDKTKAWGEVLIGFAILFMGLAFLKDSVPDLNSSPEILKFLGNYTDLGFFSILIFIFIGTILTLILQSSSASMALTLVMANNGWIPFELAAAMVLGENIGTTVTANLAALIANVHAKRAAFAHFIFNVFGVIWMIFVMKYFLGFIDSYLTNTDGSSPFNSPEQIPIALSLFHTLFNIINTLILIWFINFIAKICTMVIRQKKGDNDFSLKYITRGVLNTAELSLEEAHKETASFGELTKKMNKHFLEYINEIKPKKQERLFKKIHELEEMTDRMEQEISNYLNMISHGNLSSEASMHSVSLLSISTDLERIGDIYYQMSHDFKNTIENEMSFTKKQKENLQEMILLIEEAIEIMNANLKMPYKNVDIKPAIMIEERIDSLKNKFKKDHLKQMQRSDFNVKIGSIYHDMFHSLEKIGDHAMNVTETITGISEKEAKKVI